MFLYVCIQIIEFYYLFYLVSLYNLVEYYYMCCLTSALLPLRHFCFNTMKVVQYPVTSFVCTFYMSQYNNCPSTPEVANLLMVEPGSEREFMSVMQPVCFVKHCDFDRLESLELLPPREPNILRAAEKPDAVLFFSVDDVKVSNFLPTPQMLLPSMTNSVGFISCPTPISTYSEENMK